MLVKDLPRGTVFIYEGQKFIKISPSKRSHQRPFAVNAKKFMDKSSRTNVKGWIPEDADVIVVDVEST